MKKIPKFETEKEERAFWESHDSTEYVDWNKVEKTDKPIVNKDIAESNADVDPL